MRYEDLLVLLKRHLSGVNAEGVLRRALERSRLTREQLSPRTLPALLPHLQRAAALFLDETRLRRLRNEIAAATPAEAAPQTLDVVSEADLASARVAARHLCERLGASLLIQQRVATVVSELVRNIVSYTPGGRLELIPHTDAPRRILVRAVDRGRGIDNLDEIMAGRYRSKTGLGLGLRGSKRLCDRFEVDTGPGGTRIEAEVRL